MQRAFSLLAILFTLSALLAPAPLAAQPMSLRQCLEYSTQNNGGMKMAAIDVDVARKKVVEQLGKGLPQLDFSSTLTDNINVATTLLPGALVGSSQEFIPIKMGTKYSLANSLTLSQKILDGAFWVALGAAKLSERQSDLSMRQTEETTWYNVGVAYARALVVGKQLENLRVILGVSAKALASTELRYANGTARKLDVDKIRVSFNATRSQLQQTEMAYAQSLNILKYAMGMPLTASLELADSLGAFDAPDRDASGGGSSGGGSSGGGSSGGGAPSSADTAGPAARLDYQLLQVGLEAREAARGLSYAEYLPTLSFFGNYGYSAMRQNFDFFDAGRPWFTSTSIGLTLKVPIFSGLQRLSRVGAAQLEVEKAREAIRRTEQAIAVEQSNVDIQFATAQENIAVERENLALAESVYRMSRLEYEQGTSSPLALVQAESALLQAQNTYYTRLLTLYTARMDRERARGTLLSYFNNL